MVRSGILLLCRGTPLSSPEGWALPAFIVGVYAVMGMVVGSMAEASMLSLRETMASSSSTGGMAGSTPPSQFFGAGHGLSWNGVDGSSLLRSEPKHDFTMQFGGGGFSPIAVATAGQPGFLGLRIVPYLLLSERYDSNVFYSPALPGLQREDYVTSFSPGLFVVHNTRLINTSLQVAATGEYYVVHPGLNYVGFNGTLTLTMNELARRVVSPGSSFLIAQSVNYSPSLPGFTPGAESTAAPSAGEIDMTTALVRSTALYRVNTLSATTAVAGTVPLSSSVLFQANYGYSIFRFGTPAVNEALGSNQAQVINSTSHSAQAGPAWRVTSSDTISLRAIFEDADYGGGQGGYQAFGGSLGWNKMLSPFFTVRVYGGATMVKQDFGGALGVLQASEGVAYTGGTSVVYVGGPQTITLTYTTGIAPSFVAAVGPLQTHIVQLVAGRRLSDAVSVSGGFTYNHSKALDSTISLPGTFFESYSGYGTVSYRLSMRYFTSLSYMVGTYRGDYFTSDIASFGRSALTFTISSYWF
jgi:hypothetical protein